ncbi:uncharacterized protein [Halyomorpha halys]|uniref:uncharacterized protein n=1 Tax=Halyomorpha halys TaxID=286706 RepID=UPI0034D29D9D
MHGEVTLQVVGALTCAGLVSLLIIAIINSEAKVKPSNNTDEVVEEANLWHVLSEKVTHITSSIIPNNKTEQPIGSSRRLAWAEEGHRLRHGGRHHSRRQSCYTGNEVLLVIGVTCLLNFAFVLVVMACVHYCSSSHKPDLSPRLESVVVDSETESDESRKFLWDPRNSLVSLHNISSFYRHKTPSHSMEQLLFVD